MLAPGITLYLLRHGETEWNTQRRFQGQSDSPLTARGRDQAHALGLLLRDHINIVAPPRFIASPAGRARHTIEIILETVGLRTHTYEIDARLAEIHMGEWEGLTWDEARERYGDIWASRERKLWDVPVPGGEAPSALAERATAWVRELDRDTVAVSHGETGRVIRGRYLGLGPADIAELHSPQDCVFRLSGGTMATLKSDETA